jgi:hypothetical protein
MKALAGPVLALFVLAVVVAADWAYYVPRLPSRIAAHINDAGQVNQWADKNETLTGTALWGAVMILIGLGLGSLSALWIRFLPYEFVNLPNKEYWLATPRRRREAGFLAFGLILWIFVSILAGVAYVTHEMFVATLHPETPPGVLVTLIFVGGMLLHILGQIVFFVWRLFHPAQAGGRKRKARAAAHEI